MKGYTKTPHTCQTCEPSYKLSDVESKHHNTQLTLPMERQGCKQACAKALSVAKGMAGQGMAAEGMEGLGMAAHNQARECDAW